MQQKIALFWFRRDLRLTDNCGLFHALTSGLPVLPIFIFDSDILSALEDKDDSRLSFIYNALETIQQQLLPLGATLDVRRGKPIRVFQQLLSEYPIQAVYTNEDYEPYALQRDEAIATLLQSKAVAFHLFKDQVIFAKNEVAKTDGSGYMVYTPYARRWKQRLTETGHETFPSEKNLQKFHQHLPLPFPTLTEMGFRRNLSCPPAQAVDETIVRHYHNTRDIPSIPGTSRMGIHLRFGTVSVRSLVAKALELNETFLGELIWREFFMQILWHKPEVVNHACKQPYDNIRWRNNEAEFLRWCKGETGYPIVDAGMRELNETGFMHNRVRMIAGSFLVKDLLIDWRWGEAYFARKLLDFELASNNGNWQWVAGCGCDAAPYFRVFNPDTQAKRFDPKGLYIKRWVPEVATAQYPRPIVDHAMAKQRCLAAYKTALAHHAASVRNK